ncbi:hypothetical protein Tco_0237839 [Tanacetum coccineum]
MENANPSSALGSFSQEPPVTTHAKFTARINKLLQMRQTIDSLLFKTMNELTTSSDTPLVSPFPHSDNDSDDGEVLNELIEYENVGMLRREKAINSFDGDDLSFQSYNTIMVEGLESTGKNLVTVVRDVYVFVGSFTYITDFVVFEDLGEFILIDNAEVVIFDEKKLGNS